jgi:hypothetical protein
LECLAEVVMDLVGVHALDAAVVVP